MATLPTRPRLFDGGPQYVKATDFVRGPADPSRDSRTSDPSPRAILGSWTFRIAGDACATACSVRSSSSPASMRFVRGRHELEHDETATASRSRRRLSSSPTRAS